MATETDEQKIATLTAQVATLTKEKADALDQVKTLTVAKEAAEKNVAEAAKVVVDLKIQLEEKQSGVIQLPTVKVGSETYELVGGSFMFEGKEVSHEVLKENSKLATQLVKERVGNLRKLEK